MYKEAIDFLQKATPIKHRLQKSGGARSTLLGINLAQVLSCSSKVSDISRKFEPAIQVYLKRIIFKVLLIQWVIVSLFW